MRMGYSEFTGRGRWGITTQTHSNFELFYFMFIINVRNCIKSMIDDHILFQLDFTER